MDGWVDAIICKVTRCCVPNPNAVKEGSHEQKKNAMLEGGKIMMQTERKN